MKLSRFGHRTVLPVYRKYLSRIHNLDYIFIELTNRCNIDCIHCGSDCVRDPDVPDLPREKIIEVLKEIKERQDPHKVMVVLSGGEPLCYPDVFDLGRAITELEFPWGMVTNGYAWNEDRVNKAKRAGMRSVSISLDGLEADHDWLRGRKGSFKRAVDTIKMLVDDPFYRAFDVITCVNKRSLPTIDSIYEFLKSIGVPAWRLFTIAPIGRAVKHEDLFLNSAEFQGLMDKIKGLRDKRELRVTYSDSGYLGIHEHEVRGYYYYCRAGINVAGIMCNGDIMACPNIDRRFRQGNIYHDSFMHVWENKYQVFRDRKWMKTGECKTCGDWKVCQGNSFHLWDVDNNRTKLCHSHEFDLSK